MAIIELRETSQVAVAWFVSDGRQDLMGMVFRDGPDAPWKNVYRFRYYAPGNAEAWNDLDHKSAWQGTGDTTEASRDRLIEAMDMVAGITAAHWRVPPHDVCRLEIFGSSTDFADAWSKQPFSHQMSVQ